MFSAKKTTFESHAPKRTRIGEGRRTRTRINQGRVKRSPNRKPYKGQGK